MSVNPLTFSGIVGYFFRDCVKDFIFLLTFEDGLLLVEGFLFTLVSSNVYEPGPGTYV